MSKLVCDCKAVWARFLFARLKCAQGKYCFGGEKASLRILLTARVIRRASPGSLISGVINAGT